jgi:type VI secretion system protein ImpE
MNEKKITTSIDINGHDHLSETDVSHASSVKSFKEWAKDRSLKAIQEELEKNIRENPTNIEDRWMLFELLCITNQWERSLKALQFCVQQQPELQATAQAFRGLIRAEVEREGVFAGTHSPAPVVDHSEWMKLLAEAIALNAQGNTKEADKIRQQALDKIPESGGLCNLGNCQWVVDSDTRLSGVLECIVGGAYRWLAFADIAHLTIAQPKRLLDLVWLPIQMQLRPGIAVGKTSDGQIATIKAFLPVRYPQQSSLDNKDAQLLAKETEWNEVGTTGVFASGQKTLMTDVGDWPILDIRHLDLGNIHVQ